MHKHETRPALTRWTGKGRRLLVPAPSSLSAYQTQLASLCGYRVDHNSTVLPIWRRHHG